MGAVPIQELAVQARIATHRVAEKVLGAIGNHAGPVAGDLAHDVMDRDLSGVEESTHGDPHVPLAAPPRWTDGGEGATRGIGRRDPRYVIHQDNPAPERYFGKKLVEPVAQQDEPTFQRFRLIVVPAEMPDQIRPDR